MANFFMSSKELDEDNEESDDDEPCDVARCLLEQYAFLYKDPDTCLSNEIYRSPFMLEMIATAQLNAITGFIDVPKLDTQALLSGGMEGVIAACAAAVSPTLSSSWTLLNDHDSSSVLSALLQIRILLLMTKLAPGVAVRPARRPSNSTRLLARKAPLSQHSRR